MNYGELKTALRELINRKDITDTLAARFINQGQETLERWPQVDPLKMAPRPKFLERLHSTTATNGVIQLPADYLEAMELYSDQGELDKVETRTFLKLPVTQGRPTAYLRVGNELRVRPLPAEDETFHLSYYGREPTLRYDGDANAWTEQAPLALIYQAAELAADHFEDERLARFAAKATELLLALQDDALAEAFSGAMSLQPAYTYAD